jgi:hypothetical protein
MYYKFDKVPYQSWGPWRNQWGYITEIAQFDEDDIILKTITPFKKQIVKRFTDWEECEETVYLIDQDRRF